MKIIATLCCVHSLFFLLHKITSTCPLLPTRLTLVARRARDASNDDEGGAEYYDDQSSPDCQLPTIANSRFKLRRFLLSSTVKTVIPGTSVGLICNPNYKLTPGGANVSYCTDEGTFEPPFGRCELAVKLITCTLPPRQHGGFFANLPETTQSVTQGTRITLSCNAGYVATGGAEKAVCTDSGDFEPPIGRCERICQLPTLANGQYKEDGGGGTITIPPTKTSVISGTTVTLSCDDGYKVTGGAHSSLCRKTGDWLPPLGKCESLLLLTFCQLPPNNVKDDNGVFKIDGIISLDAAEIVSVGSTVTLDCNAGYAVSGGSNRSICLKTGQWDAKFGRCQLVVCQMPDVPNGSLVVEPVGSQTNALMPGTWISVRCSAGYYVASGVKRSRCNESAHWEPRLPQCERVTACQLPNSLENGQFILNNRQVAPRTKISHGFSVNLTCNDGYAVTAGSTRAFCLSSGEWDVKLGTCHPVVCQVPTVPNGVILNDNGSRALNNNSSHQQQLFIKAGTWVRLMCNSHFDLVGGAHRSQCSSAGEWLQPLLGRCEPVLCQIPHITNGVLRQQTTIVTRKSVMAGTSVTLACNSRFVVIEGTSTAQCTDNGQWDHPLGRCEFGCVVPALKNGLVNPPSTTFCRPGTWVDVTCDAGFYVVQGNERSQCTGSAEWQPPLGNCAQVVTCHLPSESNGTFKEGRTVVASSQRHVFPGAFVTLTCNDDYEVASGAATSFCLSTGLWSAEFGQCQRLARCQVPLVSNGFVKGHQHNHQDDNKTTSVQVNTIIAIVCDKHYRLTSDGFEVSQCTQSGKWDRELGRCEPIMCRVPSIANGLVEPSGISEIQAGSWLRVSCNQNFRLVGGGNGSSLCTDSAQWDPDVLSGGWRCESVVVCVVPSISNANLQVGSTRVQPGDSVETGSWLTVICHDHCRLADGATTSLCLANGQWRDSFARCEPVVCEMPVVTNGILKLANVGPQRPTVESRVLTLTKGTIVTLECGPSHLLVGNTTATCLASGLWHPQIGLCVNHTEAHYQLGQAAQEGNVAEISRLLTLKSVINVNWRDPSEYRNCYWHVRKGTALHRAMTGCNRDAASVTQTVQLLLQNGADADVRESYFNSTALMMASYFGNVDVVRALLSKGADVNAANLANETALIWAAGVGQVETVRLLLNRGADVNAKTNDRKTPLMIAAYKGEADIVRLLLNRGADVNARTSDEKTALMIAAYKDEVDIVRLLLNRGAVVDARTSDGMTALMFAAQGGGLEGVKMLLDRGAEIDARNSDDKTALMLAALNDKFQVVEFLLSRGASREGCYYVLCDVI